MSLFARKQAAAAGPLSDDDDNDDAEEAALLAAVAAVEDLDKSDLNANGQGQSSSQAEDDLIADPEREESDDAAIEEVIAELEKEGAYIIGSGELRTARFAITKVSSLSHTGDEQ